MIPSRVAYEKSRSREDPDSTDAKSFGNLPKDELDEDSLNKKEITP